MSILNIAEMKVDETFEPEVVKAGEEYKLRIVSAIEGTDKNGDAYFMPFFEVADNPRCKEFGHYMPLPNESTQGEKDLNKNRLAFSSFMKCFSIEGSELDTEKVAGHEGWAILGMGKDQDDQPQNKINKFIAGA